MAEKHKVLNVSPDYEAMLPTWKLVRDCVAGSEVVKEAGTNYLPSPPGFAQAPDPDASYAFYLDLAQFPEIVEPTIRGLTGVIHAKPSEYDLSTKLEPLLERATLDGITLEGLHHRLTQEVLTTGRYALLPDVTDEGVPHLACYPAEALVNWGLDEKQRLAFAVLDESAARWDAETLEWTVERRWLLLQMVDGRYQSQSYVQEGERIVEDGPVRQVKRRGGTSLEEIPLVVVGATDLTPWPDKVPLRGLAQIAVAIYRLDADYRRALYLTAQPTPVVVGINTSAAAGEQPLTIGSGVAWRLPAEASASFLEFSGAGIEAQRQAIQDERANAAHFGAQFVDAGRQAESGEALELRRANQTATITTVAQTTAAGLERALRHLGTFLGEGPEAAEVRPNLEFAEIRLTAQEVAALVAAWQANAISLETLHDNLRRGRVMARERTTEEEIAAIEDEQPKLTGMAEDDEDADESPPESPIDDEEVMDA